MPAPRPLKLAFDRRLRALGAGLSAPLDRDAEALHRARVASRRLRAAIPLLETDSADSARNDRRALAVARREIHRLTAALGQVREMDVALSIVRDLRARRPDLAAGVDAIGAAIERERATRLGALRERVSLARLQRVSRVLAQAAKRADDVGAADAGVAGLRSLADRLTACIDHAGVLYAVDRLHAVRIAAKKLRYALELEGEIRGRSTGKWVSAVRHVQDILGRLHDLDLVAGHAAVVAGGADIPGEIRSSARLIVDILEQEIHERHASYLGSRDDLRRVVHAVRHGRRAQRTDAAAG